MEDLIYSLQHNKISTYNLFNYLFLGIVFVIALRVLTDIALLVGPNFLYTILLGKDVSQTKEFANEINLWKSELFNLIAVSKNTITEAYLKRPKYY